MNPASWKMRITSKDIGTMQPFRRVSPMRMAQNLPFLSTRKHSEATGRMASRKSLTFRRERSASHEYHSRILRGIYGDQ